MFLLLIVVLLYVEVSSSSSCWFRGESSNDVENTVYGSSTFYDSRTQLVDVSVFCRPKTETFDSVVLRRHAMNRTALNLDFDTGKKAIFDQTNLPEEILGALGSALQNLFSRKNEDRRSEDYESVHISNHPSCSDEEIPYLVATKLNGEEAVPTGAVTWVTETLPRVGGFSAIKAYGQVRYQLHDGSLVHGFASLNFAALSCDRLYATSVQGDFGGTFVRIPQSKSDVLNRGVDVVLNEKYGRQAQQNTQHSATPQIYARSDDSVELTHIIDADKMLNEIEIQVNVSKSLNMLSLNASYHVIEPLDKVLVVSPSQVKNLFVDPEIKDDILLSDDDLIARVVFCVDMKSRMKQVGWYVSSSTTTLILLPLRGPLRLVEGRSSGMTTIKNDFVVGNIVQSMEMRLARRGFMSSQMSNVFRWHETTETFVSELISVSDNAPQQQGGGRSNHHRQTIELQVKPDGGFKFK